MAGRLIFYLLSAKAKRQKEEKCLKKKTKVLTPAEMEVIRTKDFFDCILPGTIKFLSDHYIVGDSYRCVWVIREYPPSTEEQAILSQLADRNGVTLRIYHRLVEAMEQRKSFRTLPAKQAPCPAATMSTKPLKPKEICRMWWSFSPTSARTESLCSIALCSSS